MTTVDDEKCAELKVERSASTVRITINRPRRRNALDYPTMVALGALIEEEGKRPDTRALVLTGEGRSFCSGADLASVSDPQQVVGVTPEDGVRATHQIVKSMLTAPVPIVSRVLGPAAGVGVPIALAADVVIASDDAYFLLAFTKVGLMPDGGASLLLPAAVGRSRALSMALLASRMPAAEAVTAGLIHQAVPAAQLDDAVQAAVDVFVAGPRQAFARTKQAINAASLDQLDRAMDREIDGQATLLQSQDFLEGATAMLQRRKPQFSH